MVARVFTVAPVGYDGVVVEVESDLKKGLPSIQIVGMGTKSIDEAKERVRSAISNSLLDFPTKKITINLAPADLVKDGAHFDLPIAIATLACSGQLRQSEVDDAIFAGELALDGSLRPIKGAINIAQAAKKAGFATIYVPIQNVQQACLIDGLVVIGVSSLKDIYLHLKKESPITPSTLSNARENNTPSKNTSYLDDIYGQEQAKRALVIAVAGRHNILLAGSPGAGKTMLAKTLTNLLPRLSAEEQIAVTKLHSIAGEIDGEIIAERPFRAPHHTASQIAIIGGGNHPKPGEISLAHLGVLFLDEMPEYTRSVLEALRQPLEDKRISITRANGRSIYPADFMLVATMNPCPCGHLGDLAKECSCSTTQILNYQRKISGPLMDRIDLTISVSRLPNDTLLQKKSSSNTQHLSAIESIKRAHDAQKARYNRSDIYNSGLSSSQVNDLLNIDVEARQLLSIAGEKLGLSARSYFKVLKVAQTIADLEGENSIKKHHVSEALQFRSVTP